MWARRMLIALVRIIRVPIVSDLRLVDAGRGGYESIGKPLA